jgi:hypothetical protein
MTPTFVDPAAQRCWDSYFAEVDRFLLRGRAEAADLRGDLEAHVVDSMAASPSGSELEQLRAALARLGQPIDYLRPILADELIDRGTRTYNPLTIARGLVYAIMAGSRRAAVAAAFVIGYLLLAVLTAMAVLKPLWGEHVGLFRHADGSISAGIIATSADAHELLGWWSIPIALVLAAALYVALTKGLRAFRHRR